MFNPLIKLAEELSYRAVFGEEEHEKQVSTYLYCGYLVIGMLMLYFGL